MTSRRIEELTEQLQKTAQPPDYAEARAALNEAPSLRRRIEELTAELERSRIDAGLAHAAAQQEHGPCFAQIESWKEMSQKADIRAAASKAGWKNECEAHQKAREALATERAALRSRDEECAEAYRLLELEKAKDGDTWKERALTERAAREQAEELRLSYWKEMQLAKRRAEQAEEMRNHWCNEYANSQNQLATAAEQAEKQLELACGSALRLSDERDTALARVKELEAANAPERGVAYEQMAESLQAAETALASARKLLERADRYIEQQPHDYGAGLRRDIRALLWPDAGLASHPSPARRASKERTND